MQKVPELSISVDPRKHDDFISVFWNLRGITSLSEDQFIGRLSVSFCCLENLFDPDATYVFNALKEDPARDAGGELSFSGSFPVQIGRFGSKFIAIAVELQDPVRTGVRTRWVSSPIELQTALSGGLSKPSLTVSEWAEYRRTPSPLLAKEIQSRAMRAETSTRPIADIVDTSPTPAGLFASSLARKEQQTASVRKLPELKWNYCPLKSIQQCALAGDFLAVFVLWHKLFNEERGDRLRYVVKNSRDESGIVPVNVAPSDGRIWVELKLAERGGYVYWLSAYSGCGLNASLIFPRSQEENRNMVPVGRHVIPGAAWMPDTATTQARINSIRFGVSEADESSLVLVCPAPLALKQLYVPEKKVGFSGPVRLKDEETKDLLSQALDMPGSRMAFATVRVKAGRSIGREARNSLHKNVAQDLADRYRATATKPLKGQRPPFADTNARPGTVVLRPAEGSVDPSDTAQGENTQRRPIAAKQGGESKARSFVQHGTSPSAGEAKQVGKRAESSSEFVQDQSPQSIFDRLVNFGKSRRK